MIADKLQEDRAEGVQTCWSDIAFRVVKPSSCCVGLDMQVRLFQFPFSLQAALTVPAEADRADALKALAHAHAGGQIAHAAYDAFKQGAQAGHGATICFKLISPRFYDVTCRKSKFESQPCGERSYLSEMLWLV